MTAHELAQYLLKLPDLPVLTDGSGADYGWLFQVSGVAKCNSSEMNGTKTAELNGDQDVLLLGYHHERDGHKRWCWIEPKIEIE